MVVSFIIVFLQREKLPNSLFLRELLKKPSMKKLLLPLALLLATGQIYAQLYVSPNGSNDSYVYVNDQVLFVEQDVNLVYNNAGTTEASIYLRNDGQLIQGTTSSANQGNGTLSVYQDSNSDAYDYNYWGSPVGLRTGPTGNNNFSIYLFNDRVDDTDSDPTAVTSSYNGSSSPLTISRRWVYTWNPTTQRWVYNGGSSNIQPGYGFTMKGTDVTVHSDPFNEPNNQLYDFRGRPNNGDITLPVQTSAVTWTDGTAYYFTLAGNPYPSALDMNQVFNDADNVEIESFRYWDEDRSVNSHFYADYRGSYQTWIPGPGDPYSTGGQYTQSVFMTYDDGGNPVAPTADTAPAIERLYAPIGQGFMIKADPATPGDGFITIKNSHREYIKEGSGNNSEFRNPLGGAPSNTSYDEDPNYVPRLRIHTIFGENTHFRDMLLMFDNSATDLFDRGMDASHPMDLPDFDAYFTIRGNADEGGGRNLVMQTVPYDNPRKKVPVSFKLEAQNNLVMTVAEDVNTPFFKAYLYDSSNNSYQEITNGNEASLLLDAGVYEGRFFITFRGPVDTDSDSPNGFDDILAETYDQVRGNVQVVQNNKQTQLEVNNPEQYDIAVLNMFDVAGRLVMTQENVGSEMRYAFPTSTLSDGIYLVRVTTQDNITVGYKVSVVNK